MKLYMVREAETTVVHGLFWAANAADLWDAVDEMADPFLFEWAEIRDPGGVWRDDPINEALPVPKREEFPGGAEGQAAHDSALERALAFGLTRFGDHPHGMILNQDEFEWTRFDSADQGVGVIRRIFDQVEEERLAGDD